MYTFRKPQKLKPENQATLVCFDATEFDRKRRERGWSECEVERFFNVRRYSVLEIPRHIFVIHRSRTFYLERCRSAQTSLFCAILPQRVRQQNNIIDVLGGRILRLARATKSIDSA